MLPLFIRQKKLFQVKEKTLVLPLLMGDHSESGFRELVIDGVVDGTHVQVVIAEPASHR